MSYKSKYVAKVMATGQLLFSSHTHDLAENNHQWYSLDDGNARDCRVVMDNKEFKLKFSRGEIVFIKS